MAAAGSTASVDAVGVGATYGSSSWQPVSRPAASSAPASRRPAAPAARPNLEVSRRTDRTDVRHVVQVAHEDAGARVGCVHDQAVADVHADVADRAVVEHQVARHQLALGDVRAGAELRARGVRERDAGLGPGHHRQARAVESAGAGRAVDVGVTDLGHGVLDGGRGPTLGRHGRRGADVAVAGQDRGALLGLELVEQVLRLGQLGVDGLLLVLEVGLDVGDLVATLGRLLATDRVGLELVVVVGEQGVLQVADGRERRQLVDEGVLVGVEELGRRTQVLTLELADHGVTDVRPDLGDLVALADLVGLEGVELVVELDELELGVVVALLRLLRLLEEPVDACAHVVDVGLGLGGCGTVDRQCDGPGERECAQCSGKTFAAVQHVLAVPSWCRTPTG